MGGGKEWEELKVVGEGKEWEEVKVVGEDYVK